MLADYDRRLKNTVHGIRLRLWHFKELLRLIAVAASVNPKMLGEVDALPFNIRGRRNHRNAP